MKEWQEHDEPCSDVLFGRFSWWWSSGAGLARSKMVINICSILFGSIWGTPSWVDMYSPNEQLSTWMVEPRKLSWFVWRPLVCLIFPSSPSCGKALQHQMGDSSKVDRLLVLACYANSIKELSTTYQHLLNCGPFSAPNLSPGDGPRPGPRRGSVALPLLSRPSGRTADCDSIAATESEKHGCDGYDATWHMDMASILAALVTKAGHLSRQRMASGSNKHDAVFVWLWRRCGCVWAWCINDIPINVP